MPNEKILIIVSDENLGPVLESDILRPAGYDAVLVTVYRAAESFAMSSPPHLVVMGEKFPEGDGLEFSSRLLNLFPDLPIIMVGEQISESRLLQAIHTGITAFLPLPLSQETVLQAVEDCLKRHQRIQEWSQQEIRKASKSLQKQLEALETLQRIGRSVTSMLDLDAVLTSVVDSAVDLTGAEEGSLLLLDENSGELYMRAARNFQDDFVRTFRLPVRDSLAGQVLRTGKPLLLNENTPQKIKTAYLVHTLVYVPLQVHGRVIGVLGVDNRQNGHPFMDDHISLVSTLADYAAIAIENARAYSRIEVERSKLETILKQVEDGIVVVDHESRLLLVNRTAGEALGLEHSNYIGKLVQDVFHHPDLQDIFDDRRSSPSRCEVNLEDGRVFNAQITPIPEVGLAVIMQDITHLKELDRIKSDFVSTVSHDLRSPLTAILGYVELIGRAGPVTEQQRDFIRRIQFSVNNITALINDLLDLGRIEAGFDTRKEVFSVAAIVNYAAEGHRSRLNEKELVLKLDVPEDLPTVFGNPLRIRQMVGNLIGNAVKYTPQGGHISVRGRAEGGQIILEIADDGPGIPATDQPYIFDKFYRGSNIPYDTPGTGLGLAIVKSIVENHQGRIWVESSLGHGATFTVVLPITDQSL